MRVYYKSCTLIVQTNNKTLRIILLGMRVLSAGLLRALFFGEKCATCVQFVECAGVRWSALRVRSICCVSIKYEFLFDKSRKISINIM